MTGRAHPFLAVARLLNTAIDADNGNPVLRDRALKGIHDLRDRLRLIISTGIERREIGRGVDSKKLATLIISSSEGALMIARQERDREGLVAARSHLGSYLETEVRLTT